MRHLEVRRKNRVAADLLRRTYAPAFLPALFQTLHVLSDPFPINVDQVVILDALMNNLAG